MKMDLIPYAIILFPVVFVIRSTLVGRLPLFVGIIFTIWFAFLAGTILYLQRQLEVISRQFEEIYLDFKEISRKLEEISKK